MKKILENYLNKIQSECTSSGMINTGIDFPHGQTINPPNSPTTINQSGPDDYPMLKKLMGRLTESEEFSHRKRVMIDFDNVIYDYGSDWNDGNIDKEKIRKDSPGPVETIQKIKSNGFEIIIFTSRVSPTHNGGEEITKDQTKKVEEFLKYHGIPFDKVTSEKLPALAYIDDRSIHFNGSWNDVIMNLNKFIEEYNLRDD